MGEQIGSRNFFPAHDISSLAKEVIAINFARVIRVPLPT
jgi:hypothetical protein